MRFAKGLAQNPAAGLGGDHENVEAFHQVIDAGWIEPFTTRVSVHTPP
jgi:hypothetical protein